MILPSAAPVGPLIYSLYDRVVTDGEVIDTGVSPFTAGVDMTLLFDMTITKNPTDTAEAYRYVLARVKSDNSGRILSVSKPSQWNAGIRAIFFGSQDNDDAGKILTSAAGRKRFVITHIANTNSITAWGKSGTAETTQKTITGNTAFTASQQTLTFGLLGTGTGLPPGTITKAEVYNTILSQAEIDAFLA